jgi:transglutaminase-like putative cysteine protease
MGPQMGDNTAWAADRRSAPEFGMAFAPHSLPAPHVYGVKVLFDRFDPGSQRWLHGELPAEWSRAAGLGQYQVAVRGRVPAGEVILPVPAYGRVIDLSAEPEAELIDSHHGQSVLFAGADCTITYTVVLDAAPDFAATGPESEPASGLAAARHLLDATVPDSELPAEVHAALDHILDQHARAFDRALAVRDFIRERYYYDPAYIEDPTVGRWLQSISRGRGNAHIAAMHAGRDARYLGRGVCYELNTLACELMRRVRVPAAIATGWTFDRGAIDEPDHLWAMALVPTAAGPRWLPVDASTTRQGMPLHAGRRPPGPWRARPRKQGTALPRSPSWAQGAQRRHDSGPALPLSDLVRVVRYVETLTGETMSDMDDLRRRCRELLGDPEAAARLLDMLRK